MIPHGTYAADGMTCMAGCERAAAGGHGLYCWWYSAPTYTRGLALLRRYC